MIKFKVVLIYFLVITLFKEKRLAVRILIGMIILFSVFGGCSKCSMDERANLGEGLSGESPQQDGLDAQRVLHSDLGGDRDEEREGVVQKVRFVQTPDGKVVPEPALKLKVPNLLNPGVLKNAIEYQNKEAKKKVDVKE